MNPEKILKKHIAGKKTVVDSKLLAATSLITANGTKELADASTLLAKTTQISADLLAKTTQTSANLLAKETERSAEQLSKSTETSVRQMKWLTIAVIAVGFIQIGIAIIALFMNRR